MFLKLGSFMGEGLEVGLADSQSGIIAQAQTLADAIRDEFDNMRIDPQIGVGFDAQARALESRVRASAMEVNSTIGGNAQAAAVAITNQFFTESSARESDSVAGVQRTQARLGLFAIPAGVK